MQINSANTYSSTSTNVQQVNNSTQVDNLREQTRIEQEQKPENQEQQTSQQNRFDVDQQVLALVEEQQQQKPPKQESSASNKNTSYDQPSNQNQTAVAAYQAVDSISQRDTIQQSFGIDLIA